MYGNGTNRIIYMQYIITKPYTKDDEQTGNSTDHDRAKGICYITPGGNGNQTCQRSVQTHRYIRLTILDPRKDHTNNGCDRRSDGRSYENRAEFFYRSCCCAVKSIPAEPEDKYTKGTQWNAVSRESIDFNNLSFLILGKLSNSRS